MTQRFRLPRGGRIDRSRMFRFRFDGREYEGHPGDTLAAALLANGVRVVARSWKFHRPRGIFAAGMEEPSALVQLDDEPNRRATDIVLYDGLVATSQHASPSLAFDVAAPVGWLAPLFPAGFYYKIFFRSPALWRWLWEPMLRRMAGLGRAPRKPRPARDVADENGPKKFFRVFEEAVQQFRRRFSRARQSSHVQSAQRKHAGFEA